MTRCNMVHTHGPIRTSSYLPNISEARKLHCIFNCFVDAEQNRRLRQFFDEGLKEWPTFDEFRKWMNDFCDVSYFSW